MNRCWLGLAGLLSLCLLAGPQTATAAQPPSGAAICDHAALAASRATGVPVDVLRAISLTETGRKRNGSFDPWPWTVNMEGKGVWFDTPAEALDYARKNHARGARSFDVGCFQINYKWHGQHFRSIDHMFEPEANALYAAHFLKTLFAETGNWTAAAGAYHSRTPKYATKYAARFERILANLAKQEAVPAPPPANAAAQTVVVARPNNFPLLLGAASAQANLGSLFPDTARSSSNRFIGGG